MNTLKMDVKHTISALLAQAWAQRRIDQELHIDRGTVSKYARGAKNEGISKPAKVITGETGSCKGYEKEIEAGLEGSLTAQRIWQDLVSERGFTGSYQSVRR